MASFIAVMVIRSYDNEGLLAAQAKYRAYMVTNFRLYGRWKADVDLILSTTEREDGTTYADCIVTE